jgi:putative glutamine amidotransferase
MPAPVIGFTTYNGKNKYGFPISALMRSYTDAVTEAGGLPILIPTGLSQEACHGLLNRLDGILLSGGGDISVEHFNGESHPLVEGVDPERDVTELALLREAVKSRKPFLGICRGFQMVNVALGGTLFTHIQDQFPNAIKHDYDSGTQREFLAHPVEVEKESLMAGFLGDIHLEVNSLHHQGVKDLAPGLRPTAYAPDGLVEGAELPGHPFGLAVQWHPEWLRDQPATRRLFRAFVKTAGGV